VAAKVKNRPREERDQRWRGFLSYGWVRPWSFWLFQVASMARCGVTLDISQSFQCNLKCEYCGLQLGSNGAFPVDRDSASLDEWVQFIERFPVKVSALQICGGEPTISDVAMRLAEWGLDAGYLVYVYTNLSNLRLLDIRRCWRLRIVTTCHRGVDQVAWLDRYRKVRARHPGILVKELGNARTLPIPSVLVPEEENWEAVIRIPKRNCFRVGPDLRLFTNNMNAYAHYRP